MPKVDIREKRAETIQFAKDHNIKWVGLGTGKESKEPENKGWNKPDVYNLYQDIWAKKFLDGEANLGFICGKASGGLVVIDFDNLETLKKIGKHLNVQTTSVETGSGKYHLYFKTSESLPKTRHVHKGNIEIDIQGEGAQVVAPCSIHPISGMPYKFKEKYPPMEYNGDIVYDIERWIVEEFNIKSDIEKIDVEGLLEGVIEGGRDTACIQLATFFRWQKKSKEDTLKALLDWNKLNKPPMSESDIIRKVESAWSHDKPYHYKFVNTEIFSKDVKLKANELLDNPEKIADFMLEATADVVDEEYKRIIVPLLLFGKQSLEISGESGEGKSHLADITTECLPKDWVSKITSLSSHALRHSDQNYRCVYLAERRGLGTNKESEADYDMKVSISEGFIDAMVAEKQPNGKIVTIRKRIYIDSFIMTTTEIAPPSELMNRIWNISIDESPEHRKRVKHFLVQEKMFAGDELAVVIANKKREILRCMFHILEKETKDKNVIIPYALELENTIPDESQGLYRHIKKLFKLMEIVTKMWHRKCLLYKKNILITPPQIYDWTIKYGNDAIQSQFLNMTDKQKVFWTKIRKMLDAEGELTITEIANRIGGVYNTIKNWIQFIESLGLTNSRMEGREKFVSLRKIEAIKFGKADLPQLLAAYDKWCKAHEKDLAKGTWEG